VSIDLYPAFIKDGEVTHVDGWNSVSTINMTNENFHNLFINVLGIPVSGDYCGKVTVNDMRKKLKNSDDSEYHKRIYEICDVADAMEAFYIAYT
jgi:hypothetical protein